MINSKEAIGEQIVETTYDNEQDGHYGVTIPQSSFPGIANLISGSLTSLIRDFWWHITLTLGVLSFVHFCLSLLGNFISIVKRIAAGKFHILISYLSIE